MKKDLSTKRRPLASAGDLVSNLLAVGIFFSLAVAWTRLYYSTGPSLIERISFTAKDPSWLPPGITGTPIIGDHYFGDLQLFLAWSKISNPYALELSAQYLPLAKFILSPVASMQQNIGFSFYVLVSLGLLYWAWHKIVRAKIWELGPQKGNSFNLFAFALIFTLPLLVDLDRGNLYSISIASLILCLVYFQEDKHFVSFIYLALATVFKPYFLIPIIILLISFSSQKKRYLINMFSCFLILNLISLFAIPGGGSRTSLLSLTLIFVTAGNLALVK